jgi:hypothetical protein
MMVSYAYWGHVVRVTCGDGPQTLRFLDAYLRPYFDIADAASPHAGALEVTVHIGESPPDAPDFTAAPSTMIDASKGFLHCTGQVVQAGATTWILMQPFGVRVQVHPERGAIDVWSDTDAALRVPMLRIIEDWVLNEVQRSGGVVLHASGVTAGGQAFLLVGNKGAGKTTGLCRLLGAYDAAKLANDNVCVAMMDGVLVARGWPAFFKVSAGTIAGTLPLADDFPPAVQPLLGDDAALWNVYEKVALYPAQGAERFGAWVDPQARLAVIYLPSFRTDVAPGVAAVDLQDAAALLLPFLQGIKNPNHRDWLGINPVDEADVQRSLGRLAAALAPAGVAMYRVDWAPAFEDLLVRTAELRPFNKAIRRCAAPHKADDGWPPLPDIL